MGNNSSGYELKYTQNDILTHIAYNTSNELWGLIIAGKK